jgi:hypothetical protein
MTEDEDFKQTFLDYLGIEAQRHRDIIGALGALNQKMDQLMTSNQDVMDAISALPIAAISAELTDLDATVKTAVSDMGTGGDAARAAMVTALGTTATQLGSIATQIATMKTELLAGIAAAGSPPAAAPAAPAAP